MGHQSASTVVSANTARSAAGHKSASTVVNANSASCVQVESSLSNPNKYLGHISSRAPWARYPPGSVETPPRGDMLTYDQFTARIAVRGGTLPSTSASALHGKSFDQPEELDPWHIKDPDPADWDPSRPLLLANLWETYDVYVNLARTGLWFDLNPFWHPTASCYYLRCEPEKKPTPRRRGATLTPREPKRRTVTIPVAADIATVSAGRMRELCALGEEWRVDLEGAEGADTAVRGDGASTSIDGDDEGKATRQQRDKAGERGGVKDEDDAPSGRWRGSDDLDPVPVSLAMIDSDGTMVVIQLQHGLVEPEVDEEEERAAAAANAEALDDDDEAGALFGATLDDTAPRYKAGPGAAGDAIESDAEDEFDEPPLDYDTDDFEQDGFAFEDDASKRQKN